MIGRPGPINANAISQRRPLSVSDVVIAGCGQRMEAENVSICCRCDIDTLLAYSIQIIPSLVPVFVSELIHARPIVDAAHRSR